MVETLFTILKPDILIFMVISVAGGLVVGAIPGLSATMAMALLTPLTFSMNSDVAFASLCAIYVGGVSGGLYSAILLRIPGTSSSIATTSTVSLWPERESQAKQLVWHWSAHL
ncbi:hypothetical protein DXA13_09395 [Clostridium sp. AM58-1XD]|nr:hypothetical protein DXA13_09395 [Clostridium sp. AM58-1XD]